MNLSLRLTVNGEQRTVALDDPRVTLLDLLRERLDLTGTKKGCDRGQCGACTGIVARLPFLEQADRAHDLARRAVAALQAVMGDEG